MTDKKQPTDHPLRARARHHPDKMRYAASVWKVTPQHSKDNLWENQNNEQPCPKADVACQHSQLGKRKTPVPNNDGWLTDNA